MENLNLPKIYEDPHSIERKELHTIYAILFGIPQIPNLLPVVQSIASGIWAAQVQVYDSGYKRDLGWTNIGFQDVQIFCRAHVAHEANIYLQGIYDEILLLEKYKELCRQGSVCVDVGANIGIHSIAMSKIIGDSGQVIALEPRADLIEDLHRNIKKNNVSNITVLQYAAYKEDMVVNFNAQAACYNQGVGKIEDTGDIKTPAIKLDSYLEENNSQSEISLIKIDVEGNELDVLRGAVETLKKHKPNVIVEHAIPPWSLSEVIDLFPYPVKITRIRNTQYESEFEVTKDTNLLGFNNLLVQKQ